MAPKTRILHNLFVRDWSLKLLAIVLGVLTFYVIQGATSFEVPYNIPIAVKVEKGIAILDQNPRTVDVTFRGSQDNLRRLDQRQMKVVIRPTASNPAGSEVVPLGPGNVEGASGVRVVSVRPPRVTLKFDREIEKQVAVIKPKILGRPLLGKVELDYEPRAVTIRGPRRRLEDTNTVSTEPIEVEGRVESFEASVRVLSPGSTWVSQIEPAEISVKVNIIMDTVTRSITNVTVFAVTEPGTPVTVDFEPTVVSVDLHGREELLDTIPPDSIQAFINCVGLEGPAAYELPVQIHLPGQQPYVQATVTPKAIKVLLTNE